MTKQSSLWAVFGATAIAALSAVAAPAVAQEKTASFSCQSVGGGGAPEPLGDRDHHSISVNLDSCRVESGPMSGGVMTGWSIWEWDGANAVALAGSGVVRYPGSTVVYQNTEGKLALTMADGKPTGWTASGKGHWPLAAGGAASLTGKSYTWTAKSTGMLLYTLETTME